MPPASPSPVADGDAPPPPDRPWRWLSADEGWTPGEDAGRLLAAIAIALVAVGLKLVIIRLLHGELGYLSYVGAVALAAWVAGSRGGVIATIMCAIAEATLFSGSLAAFLASPLTEFQFALFLAVGFLVTWITSHLRQAMVHERSARAIGEQRLEAQVAAHRAAERDRAALAGLQAVTASLAGAATPIEVANAILDRGLTALGARAGGVSRLADDGQALDLVAARGYPEQAINDRTHFDLAGASHLRDAVVGGAPIFLTDPVVWRERYPDSAPAPLPDSPTGGSLAVLPLKSGGRTIGAVVFRFASPEELDGAKQDLAQRLADQGAQALDRAVAYDRERTAREALERSEVRLTFLAATSELITSKADIETTASDLPRLAVPGLADWCAIRLLDHDLDLVATAARSPAEEAAVERLATVAPPGLGPWLAPGAASSGAVASIAGDASGRPADPQAAAILEHLATRSVVMAPIGGPSAEFQGWLILGSATPDRYGPEDLAMVRDVAGRVAVAAERSRLFAAVTRFKATVDVTEDAVYMLDPESLVLTYVNRGGADLVGFDEAELDGQSIHRLQPAAQADAFRSRLAEMRHSDRRSVTYTGVLARRDGTEIPVDARLQEVTLPDGARTVIFTARDISDRIDVQAQLARIAGVERRQAAELRAVIQAMGEGIMVVDSSGRISLANDAVATILGGDAPAEIAELDDRLELGSILTSGPLEDEAGQDTGEGAQPRTIRLDDGRWIEVATYPTDLGGTVTRGVACFADHRAP